MAQEAGETLKADLGVARTAWEFRLPRVLSLRAVLQASRVDVLEITWPGSGYKQVLRNVAANQRLELVEGR